MCEIQDDREEKMFESLGKNVRKWICENLGMTVRKGICERGVRNDYEKRDV
jgi:hypothetical protein